MTTELVKCSYIPAILIYSVHCGSVENVPYVKKIDLTN